MVRLTHRLFVAIVFVLVVAACGGPSASASPASASPVSGPEADLARVVHNTAQLKEHASQMMQAARIEVMNGAAAKQAYQAMVELAATDESWLPSAHLPGPVLEAYARLLKNVLLNAVRLQDGSSDGYFRFLGSSLAPVWIKDMDALLTLTGPPD